MKNNNYEPKDNLEMMLDDIKNDYQVVQASLKDAENFKKQLQIINPKLF